MYAKLTNGILRRAPKMLHVGDRIVYNPTDEMLTAAGYLPVEYTDPPEVDEDHYLTEKYTERDGRILQVWEENEIERETEA